MDADQYTDFETRAAEFDAQLWPLTITVGAAVLQGSGSVGNDEVITPEEGGHVIHRDLEVVVKKADWSAVDPALADPKPGLLVTVEGVQYAVTRVFGRGAVDPVWALRLSRQTNA